MINVIRCGVFLYYTNNLFPYYLKFVNYFRSTKNQHMLFLASKRRPIDLQKVPFKALINALLKSN